MFVSKIKIENYKNIKNFCANFNKNVILVQSQQLHASSCYTLGKTNFLNAILWCFGKFIKCGGEDANLDVLTSFKNKVIKNFNTSVSITFKDDVGNTHNVKRVLIYSYNNISNESLKINNEYYVTQQFFVNNKQYNLTNFLSQVEEFILPVFIDNTNIYSANKYKFLLKNKIKKTINNQIFIVSYDNCFVKPVVKNLLDKLSKSYQVITINDFYNEKH